MATGPHPPNRAGILQWLRLLILAAAFFLREAVSPLYADVEPGPGTLESLRRGLRRHGSRRRAGRLSSHAGKFERRELRRCGVRCGRDSPCRRRRLRRPRVLLASKKKIGGADLHGIGFSDCRKTLAAYGCQKLNAVPVARRARSRQLVFCCLMFGPLLLLSRMLRGV